MSGEQQGVEVRVEDPEGADAVRLLAALEREKGERYPDWDAERAHRLAPAELTPPQGAFLIAYLDGEPVGCGGVRFLGDEVGELKRLYVDPRARGSGAGMALMSAMEDAARKAGHRVARLDTDPSLEEAQELFARRGYRQIPPYNDNPNAAAWWEKEL